MGIDKFLFMFSKNASQKKVWLLLALVFILILFVVFLLNVQNKVNSKSEFADSEQINLCFKIKDRSERIQCWESLVDNILEREGLDKAFMLIGNLFDKDEEFASECHAFAHKTGEFAFDAYSLKKQIELSEKTSYCGYGFYHGFMEKLLHTTGDLDQARSFCDFADSQLAKKTIDAKGACYHGIGHGAVDGEDSRSQGDPLTVVSPGLHLCEQISVDSNQLFRCTSGAFNALEILMSQGKSGLSLNKKDPFWVCRNQPERYQRSCYIQMVVAAMNVTLNDFVKAAKFIETIPNDSYAIESLEALVFERIRLGYVSFDETLKFCRGLNSSFISPCIRGYGEGLLKYGSPGLAYEEVLSFCSYKLLTDEEKEACFLRTLSLLRVFYSITKSKEICMSVEERYRWNDCNYY